MIFRRFDWLPDQYEALLVVYTAPLASEVISMQDGIGAGSS